MNNLNNYFQLEVSDEFNAVLFSKATYIMLAPLSFSFPLLFSVVWILHIPEYGWFSISNPVVFEWYQFIVEYGFITPTKWMNGERDDNYAHDLYIFYEAKEKEREYCNIICYACI